MARTLWMVLVLLLSSPVWAQDRDWLLAFEGNWAGTGQSRTGPDTDYVPAECSFVVEWTRQGLRSDGTCSGARQTFAAGGIVRLESDGTLSGTFMAPYMVQTSSEAIRIEGGRLVAYLVYEDNGDLFSFRVEVTAPVNGAMSMRSQMLIEGVYRDVAHVDLRAQ